MLPRAPAQSARPIPVDSSCQSSDSSARQSRRFVTSSVTPAYITLLLPSPRQSLDDEPVQNDCGDDNEVAARSGASYHIVDGIQFQRPRGPHCSNVRRSRGLHFCSRSLPPSRFQHAPPCLHSPPHVIRSNDSMHKHPRSSPPTPAATRFVLRPTSIAMLPERSDPSTYLAVFCAYATPLCTRDLQCSIAVASIRHSSNSSGVCASRSAST